MSTCYFPSGDIANGYQACGSGGGVRHCCSASHYCLSNSLCLVPSDMSTYRGGCTAEKWDDKACSNICLKYSTYSGVWRCAQELDGSQNQLYACDPTGCGNSTQMFTVGTADLQRNNKLSTAINLQAQETKTVQVTAATITGSCASTADASPGADAAALNENGSMNNSTCEEGISTGAAVGIGLGPAIPLLIALAVMTWLFFRERKRARSGNMGADGKATHASNPNGPYNGYYDPPKQSNAPMAELGTPPIQTAELDGSVRR